MRKSTKESTHESIRKPTSLQAEKSGERVVADGHNGVFAVDRALTILACFNEQQATLSLKKLAEKTGFYKSTILRLTTSLIQFGFLQRDERGYFHLGVSLWRLGSIYRRTYLILGDKIRPVLRNLVDKTAETASFYVCEGEHHRICLYRHHSPKAICHHLDEGSRFPMDKTAAAKVLKTYSSPERYTEVLDKGYALSKGVRDPEVAAIAVPVFDHRQQFLGALTVSTLLSRCDESFEKLTIDALRQGQQQIARTAILEEDNQL